MLNTALSALGVSVALLDTDGVIVDVNDVWRRFAQENDGSPGATDIGINYLEVCRRSISSVPEAAYVMEGIRSVMAGKRAQFEHEYRCDSWDRQRWFTMRVVPAFFVENGVIVTHQDDTEIKKAESRHGELLDSVRAIVWRADPAFRTTYVSKQSEEILGYPPRTWVDNPDLWKERIHPDDRDWVFTLSSNAVREGRKHAFEYRMITADGRTLWLRNLVTVVLHNGEPRELMGVSVDITERKQAEEVLRHLPRRLLRAQEQERASIARELHDGIGQNLAILAITLSKLEKECAGDAAKAAAARESHLLAVKIADDVRRLSHGLHPSSLELLGLASAVRQLCSEFAAGTSAKVHQEISDLPANLGRDVETSVFRVLQECLHNVIKHSKAQKIDVKMWAKSGELRLQVQDDGVGFDPEKATTAQGLGLASMNERMRLIRGSLELRSSPGEGTLVDGRVPL